MNSWIRFRLISFCSSKWRYSSRSIGFKWKSTINISSKRKPITTNSRWIDKSPIDFIFNWSKLHHRPNDFTIFSIISLNHWIMNLFSFMSTASVQYYLLMNKLIFYQKVHFKFAMMKSPKNYVWKNLSRSLSHRKGFTKTSPNLLHTKNETMCLDPHFDSDNEDNPRESKPSLQFLRSISLTSIIVWP